MAAVVGTVLAVLGVDTHHYESGEAAYAVGTPFGWVVLVPLLVAGGMWTAALARLNS